MKLGVRIPKDVRPAMIARAVEIDRASKTRSRALADIAAELDVSEPTARNLLAAGLESYWGDRKKASGGSRRTRPYRITNRIPQR